MSWESFNAVCDALNEAVDEKITKDAVAEALKILANPKAAVTQMDWAFHQLLNYGGAEQLPLLVNHFTTQPEDLRPKVAAKLFKLIPGETGEFLTEKMATVHFERVAKSEKLDDAAMKSVSVMFWALRRGAPERFARVIELLEKKFGELPPIIYASAGLKPVPAPIQSQKIEAIRTKPTFATRRVGPGQPVPAIVFASRRSMTAGQNKSRRNRRERPPENSSMAEQLSKALG